MEGVTGMYVAEIPPGGALEREKHLYEEVICILSGQGATEVWQDGGQRRIFEWGPWSVFAPPLNSWHRLINGSREPVKFVAVTTAPIIMDVFHNPEFVFDCPYRFLDRYAEQEDYFGVGTKRYTAGLQHVWETNFIPNLKDVSVDTQALKGAGVRITQFELSGNGLIGHVAEWPVGRYHKAHYHGPGAVLLILQSEGYVLLWPKEAGTRPYESGRAGQIAIRSGSRLFPTGFHIAAKRQEDGVYIDIKKGGTLIEYEDEDPEIRRGYEEALKKTGVACHMPPVSM